PSACSLRSLHSFPTRRSSDLGPRPQIDCAKEPAGQDMEGRIRGGRIERHVIQRCAGCATALVGGWNGGYLLVRIRRSAEAAVSLDRKSTRLNSSHDQISYAVF